ncbi:protein kinase domain-containing protein [Actinoplanes sp. CA-030573]|uniref:serine/threonine-protein kinase n=1 Tax=Actinoplanes sp. CA-030573 TaxID=3239898 RepID=UPI003D89EDF7
MSDEWPGAGTLLAARYRLVALLETGGMAQIWHARDESLDRNVAVKLPKGPQVVWREARMAAKLQHPAIAAVHDYREAVRPDGTVSPFVVMELLAGETVAARLVRETFTWPEAARVGAAVADALAAAHAGGVVHRDIKPGNVMLTPTGVKILDFGISATAGEPDDDDTGATFGTPAYVAPERLDGMPAEPATDVYGLGVLLFEMVTGQPPYPVETWEELDEARLSGPRTLPESLPTDFRAVVEGCLAENPADRPPASEVRFTLTSLWLADQPDPDAPAAEPAASAARPAPAAVRTSARPAARPASAPPPATRPTSAPPATRPTSAPPATRPTSAPPATRPASAPPATRPTSPQPVLAPQFAAGASPVRPRVAEMVWPEPVSGRVAADTLPLTTAPPKRPLAFVLGVLALLVAAGGIYAVVNRPQEKHDTPAAAPTATLLYSLDPPVAPPATRPSSAAPTTTSPTPKLSFDDALSNLRSAVENGRANGSIRGDVATDFLNLIRNLGRSDGKDVDAQVAQLRRKIAQRTGEDDALTPAQAAVLRARVTDLDRAAGM